ncbi:hypothetical protein Q9966_004304 [Columba livia]|nr:hypothetical protein Q9966_004304 [Columba livia]
MMFYDYLQGGRPHQPLQCSITLTVKKCFLMFRGNVPCFSLCPLPLVLSLYTTEKSLAPSSLHLPLEYLYTLMRSTRAFSRLDSPSSLSLAPYDRCSRPIIILVALSGTLSSMSVSLLHWRAQRWAQPSRCGLPSAEQRARVRS